MKSSGGDTSYHFDPPRTNRCGCLPAIRIGRYEVFPGSPLGKSETALVREAFDPMNGHAVVIKSLAAGLSDAASRAAIAETVALAHVRHDNVVRLLQVMYSPWQTVHLVLEHCAGGSLLDAIQNGPLPEATAACYFAQLVAALSACHEQGVCHRDIKPDNILLVRERSSEGCASNGSEALTVRLADFGFARRVACLPHNGRLVGGGPSNLSENIQDERLHTMCGTPHFAAPEVLRGAGYDGKSADAWSTGCVLYAMLEGALPFDDHPIGALVAQVMAARYPPLHEAVSNEAVDLLSKLLVADPRSRPALRDVHRHGWFHLCGRDPNLALPHAPGLAGLPGASRVSSVFMAQSVCASGGTATMLCPATPTSTEQGACTLDVAGWTNGEVLPRLRMRFGDTFAGTL